MRQIISRAVVSGGVVDIFGQAGMANPELSILSDEFLDSLRDSEHKHLGVEVLNKLLTDELAGMLTERGIDHSTLQVECHECD